jgi:hypothetical protein
MTLPPDPFLHTPSSSEPPRGHDQGREEFERALAEQPARPLTDEEREAAERGPAQAERVHAPASARTPKPPAPGHDALVGPVDDSTPERRALPADETTASRPWAPGGSIVLGASTGSLAAIGAAAAWRYTLWRRERDRPIARIRRRVRRAAAELGHRLPDGGELARRLLEDERARPAGGLALGALVAALLVNRTLRARAGSGRPPDGRTGVGRWRRPRDGNPAG